MARARVLVVEDEVVVALFLEDLLTESGYAVAGVVSHLSDALSHPPDYDLAILDVHLNGRTVFDFAERLAARGTPFIFATGYGERGIPERFSDRPVLQKPYRPDDLYRALARLAAQADA